MRLIGFATDQDLTRLKVMTSEDLRRRGRETQALEQTQGTLVRALSDRREVRDLVVARKLTDKRLRGFACEPAAPVGAGEFIRDGCLPARKYRCLHIADQLRSAKSDHPVQPKLSAVGGAPGFQFLIALTQPLE